MRKATLCFLLLLCSAAAFGQEPQWTVVKHVSLMHQDLNILLTTILIPTEPGLYRISFYLSGGVTDDARIDAVWTATLAGSDVTSAPLGPLRLQVPCNQASWVSAPSITVSLKPQVPLTYQVIANGNPRGCQYNLGITVEQLLPASSSAISAGASPGALP